MEINLFAEFETKSAETGFEPAITPFYCRLYSSMGNGTSKQYKYIINSID
jgi:hypothetical protein